MSQFIARLLPVLLMGAASLAHAGRGSTKKSEVPTDLPARIAKATLVVCSRVEDSTSMVGTGFVVSADGLLITADHVIMDEDKGAQHPGLGVIMPGTTDWREARVVRRFLRTETDRNVALLQVVSASNGESFDFLPLAEPEGAGEPILVCAYPGVFEGGLLQPFMRAGILATGQISVNSGPAMVVMDLPLVPGFSGAPVVSRNSGGVLGVARGLSAAAQESGFSVALRVFPGDLLPVDAVPVPAAAAPAPPEN
jgi:hypothetical protein